jgi:hypothetical protein
MGSNRNAPRGALSPQRNMVEALRQRLLDPGLGATDILSLTDAILALQRASLAR